jgi:hypothetical protein
MQEKRGEEVWLLLFLYLGTRWGERHVPAALYPVLRYVLTMMIIHCCLVSLYSKTFYLQF